MTLEVAIGGGKEAEGVAKTRAGKLVTALEEENYPESQVPESGRRLARSKFVAEKQTNWRSWVI